MSDFEKLQAARSIVNVIINAISNPEGAPCDSEIIGAMEVVDFLLTPTEAAS